MPDSRRFLGLGRRWAFGRTCTHQHVHARTLQPQHSRSRDCASEQPSVQPSVQSSVQGPQPSFFLTARTEPPFSFWPSTS